MKVISICEKDIITQRGAQTHNPEIKSLMLYQLSSGLLKSAFLNLTIHRSFNSGKAC